MTPSGLRKSERTATEVEILRAIADAYVQLAAALRALCDTLDARDPPCMSYGPAREDGERRAADIYDDAR